MNMFRKDQFLFLLIVATAVAALIVFWSIMDMVLVGASLAVVLIPVHHRLGVRIKPGISAGLITTLVAFGSAIFTYLIIVILAGNALILTTMFGTIASWLNNPATNLVAFGFSLPKASITSMLTWGVAFFVDYQKTLISYLPVIAFKVFVLFLSLFVFLLWGKKIKSRFMHHVPAELHRYVRRLSEITGSTLYIIYAVQIAIAVLTFFIALPVFYLLGYGNILFFSFLAALCELVPVLGSSVAFIIIGAYSLAIGDTRGVLIMFILGYLVVSAGPEIFIRPVLVGRRVRIHPVIMFIGIIGGLLTLGLAGFVLGPVIIVLLITIYKMYVHEKEDAKDTSLLMHS
jgi:predicted PurR-regulated permease PerM